MKKIPILISTLVLACAVSFVQVANAGAKAERQHKPSSSKVVKKTAVAKPAKSKKQSKDGGVCFSCVH